MILQKISSDKERIVYEIDQIGADSYAMKMWQKGVCFNIKVKDINYAQANIIKQEAIASGIDAVVSKGTVSGSKEKTDLLILSNQNGLLRLIKRLTNQPFGLSQFAEELKKFIQIENKKYFFARDKKVDLSSFKIMGIMNCTPDSFSDGGELSTLDLIDNRIQEMIEYADILDIGGESTRPGAEIVSADEEIKRISYSLEKALNYKNIVISVDTNKAKVAEFALKRGAHIINDISGLKFDNDMAKVCADYEAAICLMHIKGTPRNMQENISYNNMLEEVKYSLYSSIELALKSGISENKIIIDPGIGFGKTLEHNYLILKYLSEFKSLGYPILIGLSRKSLIGKLDNSSPKERDLPSKVLEAISIVNGADIIRTHDVKSLKQISKVVDFYKKVAFDG